ncbi:MAG: hypothetical protein ACKV22_10675 [Bryobacteraceae bacterium]
MAVILAMVANPLIAGNLDLFLQNSARLDESTIEAFRAELGTILAASGRPAVFTIWRPGIVTIILRREPPEAETSALGGTRIRNGRLVPEIELFVAPTAQMVGTRLPAVLGRALARVATHELGHWLSEGSRHSPHGVMMERLSAAHLMAPDRGFFRLPPGD